MFSAACWLVTEVLLSLTLSELLIWNTADDQSPESSLFRSCPQSAAEAKDHTARLRTKALINLLSIFHLRDSLLGNGPDARAAEPIPAPFIR